MRIICTICSRVKREGEELLPARVRYAAPHIQTVEKIAEKSKKPFFILSGKYGVISGDEKIPSYDYYLEANTADALSVVIAVQLKEHNITEIDFYTEQKATWAPYQNAITKGAELAQVALRVYPL